MILAELSIYIVNRLNILVIPVGVEYLIVRDEEAMNTITVKHHFLDVSRVHEMVDNLVWLTSLMCEICPEDILCAINHRPKLRSLHGNVFVFLIILTGPVMRIEFEGILQRHLVLLETIHRVQLRVEHTAIMFSHWPNLAAS